jgi:hypothetical protein
MCCLQVVDAVVGSKLASSFLNGVLESPIMTQGSGPMFDTISSVLQVSMQETSRVPLVCSLYVGGVTGLFANNTS